MVLFKTFQFMLITLVKPTVSLVNDVLVSYIIFVCVRSTEAQIDYN